MALEKAKFVNNNNNKTITVQFNPSNLSITTNAMVSEQKTQQMDSDSFIINMGGIESRQLNVTLVLDSYKGNSSVSSAISSLLGNSNNSNVKDVVDQFEDFMNTSTDISFIWGKIIFTGVIRNLQTRYEMFNTDGSPARATLEISMEENAYQGQDSGGFGNADIGGLDMEEDILGFMLWITEVNLWV